MREDENFKVFSPMRKFTAASSLLVVSTTQLLPCESKKLEFLQISHFCSTIKIISRRALMGFVNSLRMLFAND